MNYDTDALSNVFTRIYEDNVWGYGSGAGSLLSENQKYIATLEDIIQKYGIRSVLDYGCGDWQFSKTVNWGSLVQQYIGVDVVPRVIAYNQQHYRSNVVKFDLVRPEWVMPDVDLIVCKDVLQHLPNSHIDRLLGAFKKHAKYILLTNDIENTSIDCSQLVNADIPSGDWRPLDFSRHPWCEVPSDTYEFTYIDIYRKQAILITT